jgi:tripartite-type tricarboxylate transporter receptor subunit TctC
MKKLIAALAGALALASTSAISTSAVAQAPAWPQRQVTVIVPFTAGGTTDLFARIFTQAMQQKYNVPFVVENRAGAGGTVGAGAAARGPKDGYTLFVGTASTHAIAPYVYKQLNYDADKDFQPISLFATLPNMLVIANNIPARNFAEFVAYAKANPGKLNYGSSGIGASNHIPAEIISNLIGTPMTHIPYRSSGEIMNALVGGHIHLAFDNITFSWPQAQGGTVRAIAVTSAQRSPTAPDVPTIAETFPGFDIGTWHGLFAPAGVPRDVAEKIAADVKEIFSRPDVVARLKEIGAVASPNTPDAFTTFSRSERERYQRIVRDARIEPQ